MLIFLYLLVFALIFAALCGLDVRLKGKPDTVIKEIYVFERTVIYFVIALFWPIGVPALSLYMLIIRVK